MRTAGCESFCLPVLLHPLPAITFAVGYHVAEKKSFYFISQHPAADAAFFKNYTDSLIVQHEKHRFHCLIQQPQTRFLAVFGCIPCCIHSLMPTLRLESQLHAAHQVPLLQPRFHLPQSTSWSRTASRAGSGAAAHHTRVHLTGRSSTAPARPSCLPSRAAGAVRVPPALRREGSAVRAARCAPRRPARRSLEPQPRCVSRGRGHPPPSDEVSEKVGSSPARQGPAPGPAPAPPLPAPPAAHLPARRKGPTPPPPSLL